MSQTNFLNDSWAMQMLFNYTLSHFLLLPLLVLHFKVHPCPHWLLLTSSPNLNILGDKSTPPPPTIYYHPSKLYFTKTHTLITPSPKTVWWWVQDTIFSVNKCSFPMWTLLSTEINTDANSGDIKEPGGITPFFHKANP